MNVCTFSACLCVLDRTVSTAEVGVLAVAVDGEGGGALVLLVFVDVVVVFLAGLEQDALLLFSM